MKKYFKQMYFIYIYIFLCIALVEVEEVNRMRC